MLSAYHCACTVSGMQQFQQRRLQWRRSGNCHIQLAKGSGWGWGKRRWWACSDTFKRLSLGLLSQQTRFWPEIVFRTVGREWMDLRNTTGYKDSSCSLSNIRYNAVHLLLPWQAKRSYYSSRNSHSVWYRQHYQFLKLIFVTIFFEL